MSQFKGNIASNPSEGTSETHHPECCLQTVLNWSNLYHQSQSQLQDTYRNLQATQTEVGNTQRQLLMVENELQEEREANELNNQQCAELQRCHYKLLEEYETTKALNKSLSQSVHDSKMFADEVARQAESLVNDVKAKMAGDNVTELQNNQSISGMILESAKNVLLAQATSYQHPEDSLTIGLQELNNELSNRVETLSVQVEDGKNEIESLRMALELTAEDGQRKRPRRVKMSRGKK